EGEGVAAEVLVRLGADMSSARQQVIQLIGEHAPERPEAGSRPLREPPTCLRCGDSLMTSATYKVVSADGQAPEDQPEGVHRCVLPALWGGTRDGALVR